ncbi:ABC-type polar amino acid transport system ATPase subunit [Ochrobactrum sp. P6BSIII]|nr:ABC-type polar amino acid transport system ATPase subunit [Ochrobactrum sp. P6BSIII]
MPSAARGVADRVVFMRDRVIVEPGPARDVIDNRNSPRRRHSCRIFTIAVERVLHF